jgi:hypothetical protein
MLTPLLPHAAIMPMIAGGEQDRFNQQHHVFFQITGGAVQRLQASDQGSLCFCPCLALNSSRRIDSRSQFCFWAIADVDAFYLSRDSA